MKLPVTHDNTEYDIEMKYPEDNEDYFEDMIETL